MKKQEDELRRLSDRHDGIQFEVADPRGGLFHKALLLRVEVFALSERARVEKSGLKQGGVRAHDDRELSLSRERSREPLTTCGGNLSGALLDVTPHDGCDRLPEVLDGVVGGRSEIASPALQCAPARSVESCQRQLHWNKQLFSDPAAAIDDSGAIEPNNRWRLGEWRLGEVA